MKLREVRHTPCTLCRAVDECVNRAFEREEPVWICTACGEALRKAFTRNRAREPRWGACRDDGRR